MERLFALLKIESISTDSAYDAEVARALEEQGENVEAQAWRETLTKVWEGADAPIQTSCMCVPKL